MSIKDIRAHLLTIPEFAMWPEMAGLFERVGNEPRADWTLPLVACQCVGREPSNAIPAAAALACMQISIILVDDLLDDDPRGEHHRVGAGRAANLALGFQAAAIRAMEIDTLSAQQRLALTTCLAWLAHATALGQHLDSSNLGGEEDYWNVIRQKSTPFYGAGLYMGAVLGNASPDVAQQLRELGLLLGEVIQIQDDLDDAFQSPAGPDWTQGRNSLPILYALKASHAQRQRFVALLSDVKDPQALSSAQQILIESGAVSYCAYQLAARFVNAQRLLASIPLEDSALLASLLREQADSYMRLIRGSQAPIPAELLTLFS